MLRKERDILQRENDYKREGQDIPFARISNQEDYADDDELIKKYENGSKAKEYYKDLELQQQRKKEQDQAFERQLLARDR
jgi:hypothetical protein